MQMLDWELETKGRRVTKMACHPRYYLIETIRSFKVNILRKLYENSAQTFEQLGKGVW